MDLKSRMIEIRKKLESQVPDICDEHCDSDSDDDINQHNCSDSDDDSACSEISDDLEFHVDDDLESCSSAGSSSMMCSDFRDDEFESQWFDDEEFFDGKTHDEDSCSYTTASSSSPSKRQKVTSQGRKELNDGHENSSTSNKKSRKKKTDPFAAILKLPNRKAQRNRYRNLEILHNFFHRDDVARVDTFARERFKLCLALDGLSSSQHQVRVLQDDLKVSYNSWINSDEYREWKI